MKSILYKGHFNSELPALFQHCWQANQLLIFLPPTMDRYDFITHLPAGEIDFMGELWGDQIPSERPRGRSFENKPVAGVFSSGSTKESRLIFYSKKNIETSVRNIFGLFDCEKFDKIFCYPQPYHTFGLTLGLAGSFLLGKELISSEGTYNRNDHELWRQCGSRTLTLGTPTHFKDLIGWAENQNLTPEKSYSCIIGGARVERSLWLRLRDTINISAPSIGYGATEASPGISHLPPGREPLEDGEVGLPLPGVQYSIDPSGLKFSGQNLCEAILEDGHLTFPKELILPDLIEIRQSDEIWIYRARLNWFINRGGEKFSIEKIEEKIHQEIGIEVLGFQVPCSRRGEDLGLLIRATSSPKMRESIVSILKKITHRNFDSNHFFFVNDFPMNSSAKADRRKAQEIYFSKSPIKKDQEDIFSQDPKDHPRLH